MKPPVFKKLSRGFCLLKHFLQQSGVTFARHIVIT
jgi:hypothetical protein